MNKAALETRKTLNTSPVPNNDLRELAMRFKGIKDIPETTGKPVITYAIGDEQEFNVLNTDTNENFKVTASLAYATDHAYF